MKFIELQELLQEKLGIEHLADLARELDVSPQAVSNWKARDRVPYKYVKKIRNRFDKPDDKNFVLNIENTNDNSKDLNKQSFDEHSVSFYDIILIFANHFKIIIITPTVICLFTIIYAIYFTSPIYVSTAKIMSANTGNFTQAAAIAAQFGINIPSGQSEPQWVYPEIIQSRTFARRLLKRKFDTQKYGSQKSLLQILTYGNQEVNIGLDTLMKSGVNAVIGMIGIDNEGSYYLLTVSSSEAIFSRDLASAVIEELDLHQKQYNKARTSETRQFIEERIADTELELNSAEEALKDFRVRNRRLENSPTLLLEQQRLSREVAVLTGVFTSLKQQLETTKIQEIKESDYVVVLDPPEAPMLRSKPKKKQMVILAGLFGLGLGVFLAFVLDRVENSAAEEKQKINKAKSLFTSIVYNLIPNRLRTRLFK